MKYQIIPVTPFQQNCSLVWCDETMKAAVIDPGGDIDRILTEVKKLGVSLEKVWLTHGHIDHVGGAKLLSKQLNIPIVGPHKADVFWLESLADQSQHFGLKACEPFVSDQYLEDGDTLTIGKLTLKVLHCPGHTPGHVVFFCEKAKTAWVGDVLFHGSVGRTDFPQSNHDDLISSITKKLWPLGRDVEFIPGHGPISTFGSERDQNPFVADQLFNQ
ncbi:MBL fold metallo-hydrolase [Shewanella sp. D64]|uniref:MBL fold metallo-hydrolase n=1 Tax=unclassified Shewanella TaxID=196818 RepID=UPI0022BA4A1C|nr:MULTISPECIES: MBL fold metallo-hydrolase [unclassified Shewanella]MEC4724698.1 MBL fold metallo-hydrolase [Shewanella sp. D64]MEC4736508.1 MBL fold metallo-hydrolase [Shewanella sp. E94]WBJ97438.1 MBL fold metallo-hydrolase [Shewanella sp. MTB7]